MIDYLEQLFRLERTVQETVGDEDLLRLSRERREDTVSSALPGRELREADVPTLPDNGEAEAVSQPAPEAQELALPETIAARTEEFWQEEAVRRVNHVLSVEEAARDSMTIHRPVPRREGEGLERRLRRDSRRYDSGFFWY